ncbi:exonuclease SbcCD subunit D [Pelosinus propionicus]|uniref:Nuclease SbcCD subunit D n=1 Tax=Pelosinus propionicus DSM 13327 TaxID=1123291 RepID=A0A1I4HK33_9FIRM|nr:exonuclease SbcCD subunit D [Pelosinus propionicus]SFL42555.1 Exodeoxyribonuclease I subunit D [Pelosinus propionicus DSM 13327]
MRFLHTSDWHLGRLFHGIHLTNDQAHVLDQFLALVRESKPDGIIIAGDIYDRAVPPIEAVELLNQVISQILVDYKVPTIMIAGNHDSAERLGFGSRLLSAQGLYVAGALTREIDPIILYDEHGPVYFAPLTYGEPAYVRERLSCPDVSNHEQAIEAMVQHVIRKIPNQARSVAIAHAFIAGSLESESERPLSIGGSSMVNGAVFRPFSYTALGHLHNSQQAGDPSIRYSGSLLKYSFAEASQQKGIHLIEMDKAGGIAVERISLSPRRDVRCIKGYFKDILDHSIDQGNQQDYVSVTLLDEMPILDAMGKLREKYPNVLQIESPRFAKKGVLSGLPRDHRKLSEKELFDAFYHQMTGENMTQEEQMHLVHVIETVYREEREAIL